MDNDIHSDHGYLDTWDNPAGPPFKIGIIEGIDGIEGKTGFAMCVVGACLLWPDSNSS